MNYRRVVILFFIIFAVVIFFIVILPFFFWAPLSPIEQTDQKVREEAREIAEAAHGVFRSDDGGKTWQAKNRIGAGAETLQDVIPRDMTFDPGDTNVMYLATKGMGLYVSYDRGESWGHIADEAGVLERGADVLRVAVNPRNREEWYAAVFQERRGRLLKTTDGGGAFREIYFTPLERFGVFDVYIEDEPGHVSIVTGQGGYFETFNGGDSWRVVRWFRDGLVDLVVNPRDHRERYIISAQGRIFRSRDAGANWVDITSGIREFPGAGESQQLFMDRSGTIYLASAYGLLSSHNGVDFTPVPLIVPPEALPVLWVDADRSDARHIIVSANGQIYETLDSGQTWSFRPVPGQGRIVRLLFDPKDARVRYALVAPQ